jgi:integrase
MCCTSVIPNDGQHTSPNPTQGDVSSRRQYAPGDVGRAVGGEIEIVSKSRRKPPRALTKEEREQWFEVLNQDERAVRADLIDISKFMLATGERIGETLAVLWEDVSLETGR